MASMLNTNLHQPSLSVGTKLCPGLKAQSSTGLYGTISPNCSEDFFRRSRCRIRSSKQPAAIEMRMGKPRVFVKAPGENYMQFVDVYTALQLRRIIFVPRKINRYISSVLLGTMLYLDSVDDTKRLYFYFNGRGGDLNPSLSLYDGMKALSSPIGTHCLGTSYNMSTFMIAAGDKGYRSGMPNCRMMLEPPAGAARGQADAMVAERDELVKIKNYLYTEFSKNTGQPIEKIEEDMKRGGLCLKSQQAMDYGIIDKIVRPPSMVDVVDSTNDSPWSSPPGYR
ncbi:ATP-dependent Clp protease proteolytic subunit-related protein 2, chloroplastic [Linum grandiflorum]